ncbi:MAG: LptF/LptG family permease [Muribaculaceae bacterium]|nr:LptF/LptG family permease [Muribaculaceae bacterium]
MRIIKRLYGFILKSFLPLFAMTFFIVLFIVLMQFLWKHIDDLVGKGLPFTLIGELFFYAAISMVPMALPLAILLASLMTYGNFGEKFELTAMKASGISLLHTMRPLIVVIALISVGAFFFQNYVLPPAQVKMWTLLFSMRQKSPEVEIPEGVFYDQIPGYNLLVDHKNRETGMLYDMMIYDVTHGGDNATILMADSGRMAFTPDMKYLYLHLFTGEQFENLREQKTLDKNVPFRRESFEEKEVLIPFDANFNRLDEGGVRNQYVGKNVKELQHTIDSVNNRLDSTGLVYARDLRHHAFPLITERLGTEIYLSGTKNAEEAAKNLAAEKNDKKGAPAETVADSDSVKVYEPVSIDSLILSVIPSQRNQLFENALSVSKRKVNEFQFKSFMVADDKLTIRRHEIELLKKYTLSVACLIFFFIGAPLGAIIRKGGLGTPLVISVLLFLFYYIIDNSGYKMARDGRWEVWIGIWLSTFVLAPLGIYVTYKAMNDSAVFNPDSYKEFFRKLFGIKEPRSIGKKEVIINEISKPEAMRRLNLLITDCKDILQQMANNNRYFSFWNLRGLGSRVDETGDYLDSLIEYLTDTTSLELLDKLSSYPRLKNNLLYFPPKRKKIAEILKWFLPAGALFFIAGLYPRKKLREELNSTISISEEIETLI